jgi:hypothetical protein
MAALQACADEASPNASPTAATPAMSTVAASTEAIRFRSDVAPVTTVEAAMKGVWIPPYDDCRDPKPGETGESADGKVCTHVMISGCTEPGKYYPDYASCAVVRTQRPFWEAPPAKVPSADDPRLQDAAFMGELAWMTQQLEASACTCCHDSRVLDGKVGQWDIDRGPIWLDTLSDTGLALFVGLADSSALGAYPASDNHGFDRERTGVPTTDTERMQKFLRAEMQHRGISEEQARAVPPFGGPIYTNLSMKSVECSGQGVDPERRVQLTDQTARYVYVMRESTPNPGVAPNMDLPAGTLWRVDVLASAAPMKGSFAYGSTPEGSFQVEPASQRAPALEQGQRYKLYALRDVGLPVINCTFTFGEPLSTPAATSGNAAAPSAGSQARADAAAPPPPSTNASKCSAADEEAAFGKSCKDAAASSDCPCTAASYCALMPGQSEGYCTAKGCKDDPSVCPSGWSCLDLSLFSAELPAVCLKP